MKTINISPLQWEWLYWLTGKKKPGVPLTFSFPQDLDVISFLHEELERLKDMQSDDITGYYEENDKRVYGNIRSINNLKKKITA